MPLTLSEIHEVLYNRGVVPYFEEFAKVQLLLLRELRFVSHQLFTFDCFLSTDLRLLLLFELLTQIIVFPLE